METTFYRRHRDISLKRYNRPVRNTRVNPRWLSNTLFWTTEASRYKSKTLRDKLSRGHNRAPNLAVIRRGRDCAVGYLPLTRYDMIRVNSFYRLWWGRLYDS